MKKKYYRIFISLLCLFLLFSCPLPQEQVLVLYYSDPQGMYLIPISTSVKFENVNLGKINDSEDLALIIKELGTTRKDFGLKNCIPEGVTFSDISIDRTKKQVSLKINSQKKRLGDNQEILMIGALVNTITELEGFDSVKINPGNLETDLDYSEAYDKEIWINSWYDAPEAEMIDNNSLALVYWRSKDKKYLVPITVPIPQNDVKALLQVLKKGPQNNRKNYLENSINPDITLEIEAANEKHIDISLRSAKKDLARSSYEESKEAILLTVSELDIFETIKIITPDNQEGEIVDLKTNKPKKNINRLEFFTGRI